MIHIYISISIKNSKNTKTKKNKAKTISLSHSSDYTRNITSARDEVIPKEANQGVYDSIWKLILAALFYLIMIVFTFGIKVPCGLFVSLQIKKEKKKKNLNFINKCLHWIDN